MRCVILAAGKGTRLMPLTKDKPKGMVEILGKPILHHIFDRLPKRIEEVILVISQQGESIRKYFGEIYNGFPIKYVVQEEQLGTGHALGLCKALVGKESFLFLFGDDLHSKKALAELLKYDLSVLAMEHKNPEHFGVFEVDKDLNVISFIEKPENPKSNLVWTGAVVLDSRVLDYPLEIGPAGEYWLTDQIHGFMQDTDFKVVVTDFWQTVSYPDDIAKAEEAIKKNHGK